MFFMGPLRSAFDMLVFTSLWFIFKVRDVAMFQMIWFRYNITSNLVGMHIIQTAKLPFIQSNAHKAVYKRFILKNMVNGFKIDPLLKGVYLILYYQIMVMTLLLLYAPKQELEVLHCDLRHLFHLPQINFRSSETLPAKSDLFAKIPTPFSRIRPIVCFLPICSP